MGRVIILGLDGATFRVLDPLMEQGLLPNLARLRREGLSGELASTIPPVTPCAWSSFATGKNPGKHRIFDFIYREPGTYRVAPVDARRRAGATLWHLADEAGLRSCIFNVPLTYPPEPLRHGCMVTGLLTPSTRVIYTHPPDLAHELDRITGPYRVGVEQAYSPGLEARFLRNLLAGLERRAAAARYLWEQGPWDLFVAVFNETDTVQHGLWHAWDPAHPRHRADLGRRFGDAFARVYGRLDAEVGWYLKQRGPDDTLIVMSDHGAGPLRSFFFVNNWLLTQGFLRLRRSAHTQAKRWLFDLGFTPNAIYSSLLRLGGGALKQRTGFGKAQGLYHAFFLSFGDVDWAATRAYSFGNMGQILVNLRGREPQGAVVPGPDYDDLRGELRRRLLQLRAPGEKDPAIAQVWEREELYRGPYLPEAPDLLFMPRDLRYVAFGQYEFASRHHYEGSLGISASHRLAGVLLADGHLRCPGGVGERLPRPQGGHPVGVTGRQAAARGAEPLWGGRQADGPALRTSTDLPTSRDLPAGLNLAGARLEDIAPTVLHLLGLPVPADMDGRSLAVGTPTIAQAEAAKEGEPQSAYSEEEKEAVKRHLRELGYLA